MPKQATVFVFAPTPLLTVTIEVVEGSDADVHLHAGGQGVWVARMLRELDVDVTLAGCFGGETGRVAAALIRDQGVRLVLIPTTASSGAYVHDRRSGERQEVVSVEPQPLTRHELDELYTCALAEAMAAEVTVLTGPGTSDALAPATYARLAGDLRALGVRTVADLSGEALTSALEGGLDVLKLSHEELLELGHCGSDQPADLIEGMRQLVKDGADNVVCSRAELPTLVLTEGRVIDVLVPRLHAVDHRGAGDSMTACIAASLAAGQTLEDGVRLGAAAGALNVTRHGLASGQRTAVTRLAERIEVRDHEA